MKPHRLHKERETGQVQPLHPADRRQLLLPVITGAFVLHNFLHFISKYISLVVESTDV